VTEAQLGLGLLLLVPLLWGLMWWGWRGRARRQSDVPDLVPVPEPLPPSTFGPVEAVYVSSTRAGDWLDRVVAHGLGTRTEAEVSVHAEGVLVRRTASTDVWVPAADLAGVRRERGAAGKFVGEDGLVVVSWALGGVSLDTALRPRFDRDRDGLEQAVRQLCQEEEDARG
jgi:hypothetical protein